MYYLVLAIDSFFLLGPLYLELKKLVSLSNLITRGSLLLLALVPLAPRSSTSS